MLVVDDANLLLILAQQTNTETRTALEAGEVFTTGSWYWRLARAVGDQHSSGALTESFAALSSQEQESVRAALNDLPVQIGLYSARVLVPVMTALPTPRRLNFLTAEAVATALLLDAVVAVTTESALLAQSCSAVGITARLGTV